MTGEFAALRKLADSLPPAPPRETWIGDDTAVLAPPPGASLLLTTDAVVVGVHADLALTGLDDLGWKALAVTVSDVAAMGGRPGHAVVTVAGPPTTDLPLLYAGLGAAATELGCPIVGGDLTGAPTLVVSVAVIGWIDRPAVLRSGAHAGDDIWVTGPLGASTAGLRVLRSGVEGLPASVAAGLVRAHARPRPRLDAGPLAAALGATAMIDVSDGFLADLGHIADDSGVGYALQSVPMAFGATEDEALGGGEDYELIFCAPPSARVLAGFGAAGVPAPVHVGVCVPEPQTRLLGDRAVEARGWQHDWGR